MGSTRGQTRTLEAARRVAYLWKSPDVRVLRDQVHPDLARELDTLVQAVAEVRDTPVEHRAFARKEIERGRPENGYQPETEYVWSCSCRPGKKSGDLGSQAEANAAVTAHLDDPTQFPGWLE